MKAIQKHVGWFVLGTLVFYLLSFAQWAPLWLPTLFAWGANIVMWQALPKGARRQVSILMGIGIAALIFAASKGVWMTWQQVLAVNIPLLAMFVAVSFLDLTGPTDAKRPLPKGLKAIINTAFGVHLLGSVINLSVLMIFADRIKGSGKLTHAQQFLLSRCFAATAWWSPFFIATGVAITYSPGMKWQDTVIPGVCMAVIAIILSSINAYRHTNEEFQGYPIRLESLFIPSCLAGAVILFHYFWPTTSILVLICLLSPSTAILFMSTKPRGKTLFHFIDHKLPLIGSQFALFLGAGIFSNGIAAIILCYPELFNLQSFNFSPLLFSTVLAGMILISYLGIHPLVSIAIVSPMLLPLQPHPTQLGFLFLSAWAISAGSSALTGLGLLMTSRYGIPAKAIMANNWYYALIMWLLCTLTNWLFL
ncbi:hypothetical protein [Marinomonas transparens]|uniref:Uncharacterized protein n=1 Tax=Marinomonas transparens TaxID=2795388 RepID=A0A934JXA2_9GAMM|nr:hypothetical protein [Marinomonas transparens]MBJ7538662.1 hypothetical protein [Marinomonas transparens]